MHFLSSNKVHLDALHRSIHLTDAPGDVMTVRHGDPACFSERPVHAELSQHIANLIARIKMGSGVGVKSERNFCLYCHARLSSLSVPAGFMHQSMWF